MRKSTVLLVGFVVISIGLIKLSALSPSQDLRKFTRSLQKMRSSSFEALFRKVGNIEPKTMQVFREEFKQHLGLPQKFRDMFRTATNQNVALATYIFLRTSGKYPHLVPQSQSKKKYYFQWGQPFEKVQEVQDFIQQMQEISSLRQAIQESPLATISSRLSFAEFFQKVVKKTYPTVLENCRKKIEAHSASGIVEEDIKVMFATEPDQDIALATYVFLRTSGKWPDLVQKTKSKNKYYSLLGAIFGGFPEVQDFIKKIQEQALPEQKKT